jgi:pimeloyl-ACP methyl ester carboxylesterase
MLNPFSVRTFSAMAVIVLILSMTVAGLAPAVQGSFQDDATPASTSPSFRPAIDGTWLGWLETPVQNLRVILQLKQDGEGSTESPLKIMGTIASPDQMPDSLPLVDAKSGTDGSFSFRVKLGDPSKPNQYGFVGSFLSPDTIKGEVEQNGAKLPLTIRKVESLPDEGKERLGADSAWIGSLDIGGRKLPLRLRIYRTPPYATPEVPRVLMDSILEKANGFPVGVSLKDNAQIEFSIPALPGKAMYLAKWTEDGFGLTGRFQQGFLPLQLDMERVAELEKEPIDQDALVLLLKRLKDDAPPSVNSPFAEDTGAMEGPSSDKASDEDKPSVPIAQLPGGIREEPFVVEVLDYDKPKVKKNGRRVPASHSLAGTITWPKGATASSNHPAVVMVTGSGPQDRDETNGPHQLFREIAHFLAQQGVVSLRYDDRGVAESTGDYIQCTTKDFADDAVAVWQRAVKTPGIDSTHVGILGHSEGGIIGPLIASWQRDVAFLILLAPPGLPGGDILKSQIDRMSELQGVDPSSRGAAMQLQSALQALALEFEPNDDSANREVRMLISNQWETLKALSSAEVSANDELTIKQRVIDNVVRQFQQLRTPWMRFFIAYDPAPNWMLINCPTLAIWGENDVQVLPVANIKRLNEAIERNGTLDAQLVVLPKLNHLFQTAETGLPDEYNNIEETIAPSALETIRQWLRKQDFIR